MTRIFIDTEFIEDGKTIELISLGAVDEYGHEFYAESRDVDLSKANPWVQKNVLPYLGQWDEADDPVEPISNLLIAQRLIQFVDDCTLDANDHPEFWGYYADYDWVVTCQLFGTMMDLPEGWPMYCRDLQQLVDQLGGPDLPSQMGTEHHALADAVWNRAVYDHLYHHAIDHTYDAIADEIGYAPEVDRENATQAVIRQLGWR